MTPSAAVSEKGDLVAVSLYSKKWFLEPLGREVGSMSPFHFLFLETAPGALDG